MNKHWRYILAGALSICSVAVLLYLGFTGIETREEKSVDPIWSEYVSAHTSGTVSKSQEIQIRFVNDIIDSDKVGKNAAAWVKIVPEIDASISFANPREIIIKPGSWLDSGTRYTISVKTGGFNGIPGHLDLYTFEVNTLEQNFEVETDGLRADPEDRERMILSGNLTTADVSKTGEVEKLLAARYNGQSVDIHWEHTSDAIHHRFSLSGIKRESKPVPITLRWDGEPLGVSNKGEQDIEVPALGVFNVTYAKVVYGQKQYVEVGFSDNLNKSQRVDDFIELGSHDFTTRIEDNVLKVYPQSSLKGDIQLRIADGIRNARGDRLDGEFSKQLVFTSQKPQIRFVGNGVIIPENKFLSIPIEAINVHSVQVTAFRIYENNIGQFLQSNKLDGQENLERVGRYLWRKTISLSAPETDRWNRFSLDATQLLKQDPGGIYRITLSINRGNSTYTCTEEENQVPAEKEPPFSNHNDLEVTENSGWDGIATYYNNTESPNWSDRDNPCKDAYYQHAENTRQSRNFLGSNIGLLAKRDNTGKINIVTTDIRTGNPMRDVEVTVYNFQDQIINTVKTDQQGFASITDNAVPFYLSAKIVGADQQVQMGYLKMSPGTALPVSHFDVGGYKMQNGVKGYIYGERGVWRPGDKIYLVLVVEDKNNILPKQHPVSMSLINPQGQVVQTINNNQPMDNMYRFDFQTDENAPTGNWQVRALLGGREFSKRLKIETVVPNRLKVELDLGGEVLMSDGKPLQGKLFAQWLHGAKADGLKADVEVRFSPVKTQFGRFNDFIFDDSTREFSSESTAFVEGTLDQDGYLQISKTLQAGDGAPGMLNAYFTSRVFEDGGAFSTSQSNFTFHPYNNYVGIKLPKGDQTRGMLLTDTDHVVEIASLDAEGNQTALDQVEVSVYKIHWKWWWDQTADSLARYANSSVYSSLQHGVVKTVDGRGQWTFNIKYPDWGRYLVRACDLAGKHCSAKVVYIDWPGWAGRAQEQSGPGASVLNIASDKTEYIVGETAMLTLPKASQGRALLTLETGTRILQQKWLDVKEDQAQIPVKITSDMAPNIYAGVTLIQPHQDKNNDRPIRLYGISSINVTDPKTRLHPIIKAADEWAPESSVDIEVSEQQGAPMTYTLAVVDEGLLGLTNYKTPDLHEQFYKKEALGVQTWDLFDDVLNAYGGELERILALGGGEDGESDETRKKRRFPPVVKFLGPFHLDKGQSTSHQITLPSYMGAVRVMVVAAYEGAYGSDSKSVFVRQPLVVLPTLPRLVGPGETFTVPVAVFVGDPAIKNTLLTIKVDDYFEVVGDNTTSLNFDAPGDKIGFLTLRSTSKIGQGQVEFSVSGGNNKAKATVHLSVRAPNPSTTRQINHVLEPGATWETAIEPHGLDNTNTFSLEVSSLPPFNLSGRLQYLVRYPYGCLEQVTSAAFPQLYLPKILHLNEARQKEIGNNIHAAIDRLRQFQHGNGSFYYWPGDGRYSDWANNYAGQFLLEAQTQGYDVPPDMLSRWTLFQMQRAKNWVTGDVDDLQSQAYRLYILALANQADMGAMNRLRENKALDTLGRWYLGAAYQLAGQPNAAEELINSLPMEFEDPKNENPNFGSAIRDKAIALNALVLVGRDAQAGILAQEISHSLASDNWFSTQSVAFGLSAVARYMGTDPQTKSLSVEARLGDKPASTLKWNTPVLQQPLDIAQLGKTPLKLTNTNQRKLYVTLSGTGIPAAGDEIESAQGLRVEAAYLDKEGKAIDVSQLQQGKDFKVRVTVTNMTGHHLENLALTHILAAGWEIHNDRLNAGENDTYDNNSNTRTNSGDNVSTNTGNKSNSNTISKFEYRDIRDDRVYTFFGLATNEQKQFTLTINATYAGNYYLPGISVEDMYDAATHARSKGQWIKVNNE
ncbi:MAG: MG2 domain-containing protein [Gammaproteobacteria bacterium]|nr:MG2 domain-containing protein [Gammaproteobacteria bacterium]